MTGMARKGRCDRVTERWRTERVGGRQRRTPSPSRHPPSLAARSLDALHRAPVTMIILDDSEDPFNPEKLLSDSRSVNRPATPTPSLPSYEFSQSQAQAVQCPPEELESQSSEEGHDEEQPQSEQRKQGCWPRKAHRKFRRALMYALVLYFVITVAVGAPIIVLVSSLYLRLCYILTLRRSFDITHRSTRRSHRKAAAAA